MMTSTTEGSPAAGATEDSREPDDDPTADRDISPGRPSLEGTIFVILGALATLWVFLAGIGVL